MSDDDYLYRFVFERFGVRGEFVRLAASWQAVRERQPGLSGAQRHLGEALAAVVLLSGTIKFRGALSLQLQGNAALSTLLVQATGERTVRGMLHARADAPAGDATLRQLLGDGRLVLTAASPSGERYQGIVAVETDTLAEALQAYFAQSEQLPTRLWLVSDRERVSGLFLQRLPGEDETENWQRITLLADTVSGPELQTLELRTLLHRLFHEEDVRLFDPEPVAFRCGCSRERVAGALLAMGRVEIDGILEEQGVIEADCEFCNAHYSFDRVDAAALFSESVVQAAPETPQ
jgi:molecular chaperone Hsp33